MAAAFDPNYEFNAPKFHDFANPAPDDDADADTFFETCDHESLPTGASAMNHVTGDMMEAEAAAAHSDGGEDAEGDAQAEPAGGVREDSGSEAAPGSARPEDAPASPGSRAGQGKSKLTDSILALAGMKAQEAELCRLAQASVGEAAELATSPSVGADGPVSSRTRSSIEAAYAPRGASKTPRRSSKGPKLSGEKRAHTAGGSSTPNKSSKKARCPARQEPATPTFERFGGTRGRAPAATPGSGRRSSSAPATGRPSMSPSVLRPTSSSTARAASTTRSAVKSRPSIATMPQLTVPVSPKLNTSMRTRKRGVNPESSRESLGGLSDSRLSTGSLASLSRQSTGSAWKPELTVPQSPTFRTSMRARKTVVSSDEMRMREAQEALENIKKRRKMGAARMGAASSSGPALSTKTLTVPQAPNLRSESRSRLRASDLDSSALSAAGDLPFAESMQRMQQHGGGRSKTPVRALNDGPQTLTEPKTPNFSSFRRAAGASKVESFEEREAREMAEAQRNRFKAKGVNRSVLDSCGDLGVPKVARKALTQAVSPKLRSSARGERMRSHSADSLGCLSSSSLTSLDSSRASFKARRAPESTRTRPSTAAAPQERKLTIPVSPNLRSASRSRLSLSANSSTEEDLSKPFKALPVPDFVSRKFVPRAHAGKLTEPAPFKLTTDDRQAAREAEAKLRRAASESRAQDMKNAKAQRAKAAPARSSAVPGERAQAYKPRLTEPKPFALQSEAKHEVHRAQWTARVEHELEQEASKFSSFKARRVPVAVQDSDKVFTPRRSSKPLTEVRDVQLNVDRRVQQHQEISAKRAARERQLESEKLAAEARRKEEEEREVRSLRKSMLFKAKRVPATNYTGGPQVVHSSKPLTEPMSPQFRTDMRIRSART